MDRTTQEENSEAIRKPGRDLRTLTPDVQVMEGKAAKESEEQAGVISVECFSEVK